MNSQTTPITIVECGIGNVGSIANMLKKLGVPHQLASDPEVVARSSKLILPGVGAFGMGMRRLLETGMVDALHEAVLRRRVPVLGVCLGMQLMTRHSEEGDCEGLGWVDAETIRFDFSDLNLPTRLPVPHMGWNEVQEVRPCLAMGPVEAAQRFYFVHSYRVRCNRAENRWLSAHYGVEFDAGVQHGNVIGVQFHPEKSHRFGLRLLKAFSEVPPPC
ncbi:MAG: imidazole glycerol phosphate synthase subunit HisH [Rubrivivax sp.]|nr:MAG: imidazole glycerol phosphate synthase subunit HisH [Rubrivivax sp.]